MQEELKRAFQMSAVNIVQDFIPFPPNLYPPLKDPQNPYDSYAIGDAFPDKEVAISKLGTAVFSNITFLADSYTDNYDKETTFKDMTFDTVIMTVNQSKNIVTTQIQGRNGTVKEYIGDGDYNITINIIITGTNNHYPISEVRDFKLILNANKSLKIASKYLDTLDISNIVIKDYEFAQEVGGYSYQKISISALSDKAQEIFVSGG